MYKVTSNWITTMFNFWFVLFFIGVFSLGSVLLQISISTLIHTVFGSMQDSRPYK